MAREGGSYGAITKATSAPKDKKPSTQLLFRLSHEWGGGDRTRPSSRPHHELRVKQDKMQYYQKKHISIVSGNSSRRPLPYSLSQVAVYYQDDDDRKKLDEGKQHPVPRKKRPFGKANPHKLPEDDDKEKQKTGNP